MSLSRRFEGLTLLEFLASVLILVLFVSFYVEWNSFRAAERMRNRLLAQIDEVAAAAQAYRADRLPYIKQTEVTIDNLGAAWPDSMDTLRQSALSATFQSVIPGGHWRLKKTSTWQQKGALYSYEEGLVLRLELQMGSAWMDLLESVAGSDRERWQRHPWKQLLRDQAASQCQGTTACHALEILLVPSPHAYVHSLAQQSPYEIISPEQFKEHIERAGRQLGSARFTDLKNITIEGTLRTNILEAGQVMRCCVLGNSVGAGEDVAVSADTRWPGPDTSRPGQTPAAQAVVRSGEQLYRNDQPIGRRVMHTGMGYLGLGDAFVGSDALYTRVLTLGGRKIEGGNSSYFSYVRLQNVRILQQSRGLLLGWKPGDLPGATSYEDYKEAQQGYFAENMNSARLAGSADLINGPGHEQWYAWDTHWCQRFYDTEDDYSVGREQINHYRNNKCHPFYRQGSGPDNGYIRDETVRPWGGWYWRQSAAPDEPSGAAGFMGGLQRRSDARFKRGIRPLTFNHAALSAIRSYSYEKGGRRQMGFVAQEVQQHYPRLVRQGEDGYLRLRYEGMVPVLWGQLGGLVERSDEQWSELKALLTRLEAGLGGDSSRR